MNDTSKTAHTPGPWSAGALCEISGWIDISIDGYPRNPVASATPAAPGGSEERRDSETAANARLIAAAPESYEANLKFVAAMESFCGIKASWSDDRIYDELPSSELAIAYLSARAAIAKATGAPA